MSGRRTPDGAPFEFLAESLDHALDRPGRRIAERTDGVPFDVVRHVQQQIDVLQARIAAARIASRILNIQPVPSRQGVHWPHDS